jgi:Pro-kumamolisin, activation domain/Abnormal spindle-like microcephaly-assoc'd, ASPM-SPD-2-Hydin
MGMAISAMAQTSGPSDDRAGFEAAPARVTDRVVEQVDDAKRVRLAGNVHPMARTEFDRGRVDSNKLLERVVMVLKRSPEQDAALAAFNERQYDPNSPDFHHWLTADEFGQLYGPSDADIASVTNWLQNHGMQIDEVGKGRVYIQFTGTVGDVERAFQLEMHNYLAEGKMHLANDRDPEIPVALSPVVTGIASLHDFLPVHFSRPGNFVKRDLKTGKYTVLPPDPPATGGALEPTSLLPKGLSTGAPGSNSGKTTPGGAQPMLGWVDPTTGYQREDLTPYDLATIYNILPLWNAATPINGTGVKVAVVALSDVVASDLNTYRSSFGLPATTLTTVHSGTDPGLTDSQLENTEDVEMVSATAPGASIVLVSDVNNATTNGLTTGILYIVNNAVAPILTMSYGFCELKLGTAGNTLYNQTFQQAATAGISSFVAAGDSGSATCTPQNGIAPPYSDPFGLAVSGMASSPYVTAVGGTDLQWPFVEATHPYTTYWNTTADAHGATAKGYMPEMSWNTTCSNPLLLNVYTAYASVEALCNAALNSTTISTWSLVEMASGGGGVSACTTNSSTPTSTTWFPNSCSGGYAKPSWQTGVAGIPADGKRDLPDISLFGSYGWGQGDNTGLPGSTLLICESSATTPCNYSTPGSIVYQENGGTSAASPMAAGIMALVVQKMGGAKQGLANPVFYSLAAKENYAACNSNTVAAGNTCVFYDTTTGSNAMNCTTGDTNCVTSTTGDAIGILSGYNATAGYDLTTGLGSMNVTNLVNAWAAAATAPAVTLTPTSLTFASTTVGVTTAAQVVTVKNSGTAALTLTSETLTGTNATSFLISANTCTTSLAAAASCTVSVEFKPAAAGALTASLSIADNATGSPQVVALSGTATAAAGPAVTLTPTSLTFASTTVGSTTAAQVVTVKNSGTAALTLTSETLTGTNAASFLISANTCTTSLAAAASCTVSVEFKPTAAGALTASLSIADNATGSPQVVTLTGTGAAATPAVTLTPTSLTFASTTVGSTTAAQVVTVKNSGTAALTLTSETLTGTNATSFLISANTCTTSLAAAATCTVSVEFKPTAAGSLTASLSIADNATGSPQAVTLTGTGAAAAAAVTLTPTSLTFASTTVGSTTAAQVVTMKNSGTAALTLTSETLTGTNATSFLISAKTCTTSLAAAASCTVSVEFKPTAAGALTASLSIADNATGSPQTVSLSGTGAAAAAPAITLTPTSIAFPATATAATSVAQVVTVKNTGNAAATISSIALGGTNATSFVEIGTCGTSLAAGASCSVYVAFKPASAAALSGTLSVTDNATGSPQTVTLTGTGTAAPVLTLSATTLAFPATTHATTSAAQTVTLTNATTTTINLTSITLAGTSPADFVELNTCGPTLAPAATCQVFVAFKPAAAAAYTATLSIADNAASSPQSVALSGTGN